MTNQSTDKIAEILRQAEQTGVPCDPVRDLIGDGGIAAAYEVQKINTDLRTRDGARLVGRKVGLTARAVQKQLGVDEPDFGALFADRCFGDGDELPWKLLMQPKVEAEITLVLGRDLDMETITMVDMMRAVEFVIPSIEVVGSRIANWDISILDTVADNASGSCFVLGGPKRQLDDLDLRSCGMVIERRGEPISIGAGAACLGHPLNAAVWLANTLARNGTPLREGELIMTGALGPMAPVAPGDVVEARISGLGSVRAAFGAE